MSAIQESKFDFIKYKAEQIRAVMKSKQEFDLDYLILQLEEVYDKAYNECKNINKELEKYR